MNYSFLKILQGSDSGGFSLENQLRQEVVYLLGCEVMQHFYGKDWDKYDDRLDLENEKVDMTG